jgi:hypothetical protein
VRRSASHERLSAYWILLSARLLNQTILLHTSVIGELTPALINDPVSCDGEIATHRKILERRNSVEAAERRDAAGEPNIK